MLQGRSVNEYTWIIDQRGLAYHNEIIELKGSLYSFEIETGQKWQCIFIGQFKMGLDKCNIGKD